MAVTDAQLNIAAFALSATGACLGIAGTLLQANAYYPFAAKRFFGHMVHVGLTLFRKGYRPAKGRDACGREAVGGAGRGPCAFA
jgi:hypothetical protein